MNALPNELVRWLRTQEIRLIRSHDGPGVKRLTVRPPGLGRIEFTFTDEQLEQNPDKVIASIEKALKKLRARSLWLSQGGSERQPIGRLSPRALPIGNNELDFSDYLLRKRAALEQAKKEDDRDDGPRAA